MLGSGYLDRLHHLLLIACFLNTQLPSIDNQELSCLCARVCLLTSAFFFFSSPHSHSALRRRAEADERTRWT